MEPTPLTDRTTDIPYFDMVAIWMSSNGVVGSLPTGLLGPVVFGLSLQSSIIICVFLNSVYPYWCLHPPQFRRLLTVPSAWSPSASFQQYLWAQVWLPSDGSCTVQLWVLWDQMDRKSHDSSNSETDRARPNSQQTFLEFATNIGWSVVTGLVGAELMVALTNDKLPIIPSIIIVSAFRFRL